MTEIEDSPELAQYKADQAHWLAQNQPTMLLVMLTTQAEKIVIEFSGGGDSGQIDYVMLCDVNGTDMGEAHHKANADAVEKITDFAYLRLEDTQFDWCNNEGGGGKMTIDVKTGECDIEGYYRVVENINSPEGGWGTIGHERDA